MHLEESNRDEGWGGDDWSIAGSKAFAWKRMSYTDEIKIYCHDLNQRILRFKGDMGSALVGGKGMFMPQVVASEEEDSRKKDSPFTNISVTRSEITSESLGAITRKAVCKLEKTDGLRPTMLFDGDKLFLQHEQIRPSERKEPKVEIYDFR
ncbi:hypothetical protein I203_105020 [Kwoniella mangroviensis CBS 8507]|uniref:uncharacterized protein n=1 Tax=Kwoniella mangroviensis CBS 8507 TaxID=1296122 RepID=UPI00080D4582|nr:uncharacterized protein I203_00035 [Kwoniella mangroviensis CBS 8507]OCF69908.1 hypothetical protein I203_00035 [Kwoniella mangroviensis CBS 8507]